MKNNKSNFSTLGLILRLFGLGVCSRYWLVDCKDDDVTKKASELYREAIAVPFMAQFIVLARRQDPEEARLRIFCVTDDRMDKLLDNHKNFVEIARSKEVEVRTSFFFIQISLMFVVCMPIHHDGCSVQSMIYLTT